MTIRRIYSSIIISALMFISTSAFAIDGPPGTFLGGVYNNYSGERENSFSGLDGFGVTILATPHKSHFRFVYGANLSFVDGLGYFAGSRHTATMYSADAFVGFSVYPMVTAVAIRPFLEAGGLGGFKYVDVANPPAGVEARTTGLSYGYRLSIGLESSLSTKYAVRMSADYIKNTADVANTSSYQMDSFALSFGLCF